jgi:hypothetical protein
MLPRFALGSTQPPIRWLSGAGLKLPGSEADQPLPATTEVKKTWFYTATSLILLHGVK